MALKSYNKKRNFKKTPEPKGKISKSKTKNLYLIQKHAASHLHYDFRLELNGVLLSWAIPKGPCLDPKIKRLAMQTEDHPVEYGSFEGIIPKGQYGGGTVMLWDTGKWMTEDKDPVAAYKKGHLRFTLKGEKLSGRWSLIRFKSAEKNAWFLIKSDDEYARSLRKYDITVAEPDSAITNYSLEEIAEHYRNVWNSNNSKKLEKVKKTKATQSKPLSVDLTKSRFPTSLSPQLATLVDTPPMGKEWIHEIKLDGYRMLAFINGKNIKLISRNGKDWTLHFKKIVKELANLKLKNGILDGEIVVLNKASKSDFQLLQNAIDQQDSQGFIYYIFDLPFFNDYNLSDLPLEKRKKLLKNILATKSKTLKYTDHIVGAGPQVLKKACAMDLEGIISKDLNSPYVSKRTKSWLKTKCIKRQEFLIGGYTKPAGSRSHFGSLLLGYYDKNQKFIYCGHVGTGFTQASLATMMRLLQKNKTDKNPFTTKPPGVTSALWVKPKVICEVEFTEWTDEGILRHPSFKGIRTDKKPAEIMRETPNLMTTTKAQVNSKIKLTHPDKILYPEDNISKLDLANYYYEISEWILPYIINRPISLLRCPANYQSCFYQKHLQGKTSKNLFEVDIKSKTSKEKYIYLKDSKGLMDIIQMGTLEIHPWGSKIKKLNYPDMIIFDLDPAPEVKWSKVVDAAFLVKTYLAKYKLQSFVKTTGGKGLHIVVPILPEYDWNQVKEFCHTFVDFMVATHPKDYIGTMSKVKRKGKIFLDYLRNQKGATAVAPYSTRARLHAPVSTPIEWTELTNNIKDTSFTMDDVLKRLKKLKKDPWSQFFKLKQSLNFK